MTNEILDLFEGVVQDSDLINRMSFAIDIRNHVLALEAERANMLKTHQDTISSYQKQIAGLNKHISTFIPEWDCNINYRSGSYVMYDGKLCTTSGICNTPKEI